MKSYFCKNCGRDYRLSECLRDGQLLYCFKCPSTRLSIAGLPLIMVGVSILVLFVVHYVIFPDAAGRKITFLPAGFGIILVGGLRMLQAHHRRKVLKIRAEMKPDETEKTAIIYHEPHRPSDPEKWDSNIPPGSTVNTPDEVKV